MIAWTYWVFWLCFIVGGILAAVAKRDSLRRTAVRFAALDLAAAPAVWLILWTADVGTVRSLARWPESVLFVAVLYGLIATLGLLGILIEHVYHHFERKAKGSREGGDLGPAGGAGEAGA